MVDYNRLLDICKKIDKDNYKDLCHDTYIKLINSPVTKDYYSLFYVAALNTFKNNCNRNTTKTRILSQYTYIHSIPFDDIRGQVFDEWLKKNDNIYGYVIQMYLLCNSAKRISETSGIHVKTVERLLNKAKEQIYDEYINTTMCDTSDGNTI